MCAGTSSATTRITMDQNGNQFGHCNVNPRINSVLASELNTSVILSFIFKFHFILLIINIIQLFHMNIKHLNPIIIGNKISVTFYA